VLEGAVAGTRPLLDKGWITSDCMIGQSGKVIGPNLFISLGASGAMHFSTGLRGPSSSWPSIRIPRHPSSRRPTWYRR